MKTVEICKESGHRATQNCPDVYKQDLPLTALESPGCPYHKFIHLDENEQFRVDSECASPLTMKHVPWFILPSQVEKFYKERHPGYRPLPPFKAECRSRQNEHSLAIIYPRNKQKIYLPVDFSEQQRKVIFEAAHRSNSSAVFWHLDDIYVGQTTEIHQMEFQPSVGKHKLTVMDENGVTKSVYFEMLGK